MASVKGLTSNGAPGFLVAWDVDADGSLSQNYSTYFPPTREGQHEYGFTYLFGSEGYVLSDGVVGGVLYDFSKGYDPKNVISKNLPIPNQVATCWVVYSTKSGSYFFTDAIAEKIYEYTIDALNLNATPVRQYIVAEGVPGPTDSAIGTFGGNQ